MQNDAVAFEVNDGVAILTVSNPPVNALSAAVLAGLASGLERARNDANVRAIVLTGAGGNFVAGADVNRLERITRGVPLDDATRLPDVIAALEDSAKPTVAAIDGFALGGGLELALGCHARVGTPRARVGLPELLLGLIPGAGGTQRLPRVAGVKAATEMMMSSRQVKADEAKELGILDEVSADAVVRAAAIGLEIADGKRAKEKSLTRTDRLQGGTEAIAEARRAAEKKQRNVTHPFACLDAIAWGLEHGAEAGLEKERELFLALLQTDTARGMIHLFFAERAAAKVPGVNDLTPKKIQKVAVIGGGTMGSGIATALLDAGVDVILTEATEELAERGRARVHKNIERNVERGRLTREGADALGKKLTSQTGYDGFRDVDLVIEAATEDIQLKQRIFAELAQATRPDAWLATNTSTIDIGVVADATGAPERVLGTHFFSPAHIMKLCEVIRTDRTSNQALSDTLGLVKRMKKTAVTVKTCTGFLVNRIFMPYSQTTGWLIDRGVDPYRIDRAIFAFGMPMGPCRMSDLAGIDVGVKAGGILDAACPDRGYRSQLRRLLVEAGRSGEKTGKGHYRHENGQALPDPELETFLAEARKLAGSPAPIEVTDEEIVELLMFGIVNEACRTIEEGIVLRASDVDVASVLGMGFPAYRGGPMKWADGLGAKRVHDTLARWHERSGLALFQSSRYLSERASRGESLLSAAGS
jgi:enoyl-CoA hydratase/3-hydroxyacyl-CoA dehydrogenase